MEFMKNPDHDLIDMLLDQSLQSASRCLDGENFCRQLAGRIHQEHRQMKLLRLFPAGMGVLAAVFVGLITGPKFDFSGGVAFLCGFIEKSQAELAWLIQMSHDLHSLLFLGSVLPGIAFVSILCFACRETSLFRI